MTVTASPQLGPFREVPYMGVIFVVAEAEKRGFVNGHPDWSNLGQGQPEVGEMEGSPPRISELEMAPLDHAYGPLEGTPELRQAIADHYNRLFRQGKASQYGPENVAVAQGGRLALSRALAALDGVNVGYQVPDYTAYEDMFTAHMSRLTPMPVPVHEDSGFLLTPAQIERAVDDLGLSAFLVSNPCNPTGRYLDQAALREIAQLAKTSGCAMLLDEFYSHFIYTKGENGDWGPGDGPVSIASEIDDVDTDQVIIFDGLTKNYRYPGWRLGWILGPPAIISTVARVASSLDGGTSKLAQRAAMAALEPGVADQETTALRKVFVEKRNLMVSRLRDMGVRFAGEPDSTFYVWGSLEDLPEPLNDPMTFFWRALDRKVMTVPGKFFGVNPGQRRRGPSTYDNWMRFSFGPPMDNVIQGLDRLSAMVDEAR
ncbi:pyridoxal phosphate-dependent aminotransferase [Nocardioides sp. LHG3406-4]|uniref:pyridoxal phosphate-dependent aminotransferase n=1 Tax=Nocardioides sp. LHG3406-4 TaxID=2804575 RepID=UPI003CED573F